MSSAPSVPAQRGALRVPDKVALASSVPRTRQPGGARADHTPTSGRRARRVPARGASGAQVKGEEVAGEELTGEEGLAPAAAEAPGAPGVRRVLTLACTSPARSLAQASWARRASPSISTVTSAWRTPAAVPAPAPDAAADAEGLAEASVAITAVAPAPVPWPLLCTAVMAVASPARMRRSPLARRRLALARRGPWVLSTFHCPSSTMLVASPMRASSGWAGRPAAAGVLPRPSASTQAMGRPCTVPWVCNCTGFAPVATRRGCHRSTAVPGRGPVRRAWPAVANTV